MIQKFEVGAVVAKAIVREVNEEIEETGARARGNVTRKGDLLVVEYDPNGGSMMEIVTEVARVRGVVL